MAESGKIADRVVLKWTMHSPVMDFVIVEGSTVIDVQSQNGVPTLWTLGPRHGESEKRTFRMFGTGHSILEPNLLYVGSAHDVEGLGLVFHIFERPSSA